MNTRIIYYILSILMFNKIKKLNLNSFLLLVGLIILSQLFLTLPAQASPCGLYDSTQAVSTGFGAAYNTLSSQKELLLKTDCKENSVEIEIGNNSANQYIYKYGYFYNKAEEKWDKIEFNSNYLAADAWHVGRATFTLNLGENEVYENNYIVAYICTWTGDGWKCGCRDNNCRQNYWQLQKFKKSKVCEDKDNDGYGIEGKTFCQFEEVDCDDDPGTGANIHPGAEEICNGIDDNCINGIDENLEAPLNDNQNGVCKDSHQKCSGSNGWKNDYSNIAHNEYPKELTCNDELDNDCDGKIDVNDEDCSVVCSTDTDCDDNNPCTIDFCNNPNTSSATCAHNNEQNGADKCGAGCERCWSPDNQTTSVCSAWDSNCNQGGECKIGTCNNDICVYTNKAEGASCTGGTCDVNGECVTTLFCEDKDNDGYGVEGKNNCQFFEIDCDDNEYWAHPGGEETCDTVDNNCNGEIDERCDDDHDKYCNIAMPIYRNNSMCPKTIIADYTTGYKGDDCDDGNIL